MSNTTAESAIDEIRQIVADLYDVFTTGDPSPWTGRLAGEHAPTGFGTDPQEFWSGTEQITAVLEAQVREMSAAGISIRGDSPTIELHGDVAWMVDQPTLRTCDGSTVPLRLSSVFTGGGGEWRLAHFHLSVGVPNETMLDATLTV